MTDADIQKALQALSQLGAAAGNSRASIQSVGQSMARLRIEMQRGTSTVAENTTRLRRLVSDFENLDDATKKSTAGQAMLAEQSRMAGQVLRQALGDFAGDIAKIGITQTLEYFKTQFVTAAKSLQENTGGTQAAFNLQNAAINSQIQTLDQLSQSTEKATAVLALIPGYGRGLAVLTGVASAALGADKGLKELQKEGMQILQTEIKKTEIALNTMSASGALFTSGTQGMRRAAVDTRLDLNELTKVVANNRELLTQLGGSVNGGVLRFREVSKQMDPFRKQLLNLGYSYEDQAQAQLDYMDVLNRSGQLSKTSAEDVAKGTKDYLINLRAVSAFTGEDAKKAQARAREASTQLAVQSKLMDMGKGAMERFQSGISNMEPFMQKALQEAVAFDGTVVDKGLNQLFAMSPARQKLFEQTYKDTLDQSLSAEDITKRYQDRVKELGPALAAESKELGSTIGAANLAIGALPELTKSLEATLELGIKGQNSVKVGLENTVEAAKKLSTTTDLLTDTLSRGQKVFKEYQAAFTDILTPAITNFATKGIPDLPDMFKNKGLIKQIEDSFAFTLSTLKNVGAVGENVGKLLPKLQESMKVFDETGAGGVMNDAAKSLKEAASGLKDAAKKLMDSVSGGGTRQPSNRPNRDLGTLGVTGSLFEKNDFFGKVAKGETVLTPKQLENLVRGVSSSSLNSGMQSMMKNNLDTSKLEEFIKQTSVATAGAMTKNNIDQTQLQDLVNKTSVATAGAIGKGNIDKSTIENLVRSVASDSNANETQLTKSNAALLNSMKDLLKEQSQQASTANPAAFNVKESIQNLGNQLSDSYAQSMAKFQQQKIQVETPKVVEPDLTKIAETITASMTNLANQITNGQTVYSSKLDDLMQVMRDKTIWEDILRYTEETADYTKRLADNA